MHLTLTNLLFLPLLLLSPLALALPALNTSTPFYLVTTSQQTATSNSSHLANVSATTIFAPFQRPDYLVRNQEPGYNSLPKFFLSDGRLATRQTGIHGVGPKMLYRSRTPTPNVNMKLQAARDPPRAGPWGVEGGYLLTVDGAADGWTLCPGPFGETVLRWRGTKKGCVGTFLQAVEKPPY